MEAWHGMYNQSAERYAAATQNESAAAFVRAMAIEWEASPSVPLKLDRAGPRQRQVRAAQTNLVIDEDVKASVR